MTTPMKAYAVFKKYVWHRPGECWFRVEKDLMRVYDHDTCLVPITDMETNENVAIWARAHGTKDGRLLFNDEEYAPKTIRQEVDQFWPGMPIIMIVCHPKAVYERYAKELKHKNIYIFEKDYEEVTWSTPPYEIMDHGTMATNEVHEREVKRILKGAM